MRESKYKVGTKIMMIGTILNYCKRPIKNGILGKYCFEPIPKVDSVVIKLDKNKKIEANNEEIFYKLIHDSFVQKRKNLKNNLKNYNLETIEKALKTHNKDLTSRAEELSIEEFIDISNQL